MKETCLISNLQVMTTLLKKIVLGSLLPIVLFSLLFICFSFLSFSLSLSRLGYILYVFSSSFSDLEKNKRQNEPSEFEVCSLTVLYPSICTIYRH